MDIICPVCCEPWELDTLHEYVSEFGEMFPAHADRVTFDTVWKAFRSKGCGVAFDAWKVSCEPDTSGRGDLVRALGDVLGDDVDGFAAELADFDRLGLL